MHAESNKMDDKLHAWQSQSRLKPSPPSPPRLFITRWLQISCDTIKTGIASAHIWRLHLNSSGGLPAQPAAALRRWRALHFLISTFEGPESGDRILERPLGLYGMLKKKRFQREPAALSHLCSRVSWRRALRLRVCAWVCVGGLGGSSGGKWGK